ncbi:MAG: hypothetical protein JWN44_2707 [Myxococcales bacterium]|nr:hypothetical protein [Myxococcales bacterium]
MRIVLAALLLTLIAGCQKASDETSAKRMPLAPPPPAPREMVLPDGLRIEVLLRGKAAPAIDAGKLRATPPDFQDTERRAWKLSTLVGAAHSPPATEFVVDGSPNAGLVLRQPRGNDEAQPVLMLNRRGDVVATMLTPNAPFPAFHGEGGRLRRPGDTTPHVSGVTRIQVGRAAP